LHTALASWGARAPTLRHWLETRHRLSAFGPDGNVFVTAGRTGTDEAGKRATIQFWDLRDGRPLGEPVPTGDQSVRSLAFSPDGRTLLAGSGTEPEYQH